MRLCWDKHYSGNKSDRMQGKQNPNNLVALINKELTTMNKTLKQYLYIRKIEYERAMNA